MNAVRKPAASPQRNTAKGRVPKSSGSGACARPSAAKGRRAGGSQGSARVPIVSTVRAHEWHEEEGRAPVVRSGRAKVEEHACLPAYCDLGFIQRAVGSRFVSQNEPDDAKARRDEQWRQAYARCAGPGSPVQYALNA
jgi:hypothetical protein